MAKMKFKEVLTIFGYLLLVSITSCCLVFILGASAEQQFLTTPHIVNDSTGNLNAAPQANRKRLELSGRPSFQDTALRKDGDIKSGMRRNEIHSSFVEDVASRSKDGGNAESKVRDVTNLPSDSFTALGKGLTDTGQGVLLTLVESDASPLPLHTDSLALTVHNMSDIVDNTSDLWTEDGNATAVAEADRYVIRAEPKTADTTVLVDVLPAVLAVDDGSAVPDKPIISEDLAKKEESADGPAQQAADDIPSFSEWAQKQLEEADRRNVNNASVLPSNGAPLKLRSKNYASPDCGAKIVAANPEALSASSVLSPSRDEYLLNACLNRVWLVIELCDSIQAKKIDIANFELFSSSPKDFSVSVSDRFPSRDWRSVGQFTASDVRDVQSYSLQPHLFGKFVKVEVHSHYGSEHFCPVSLLRVYGTSVMEVLDTEEEVHHAVGAADGEDDDEAPLAAGEEAPRNLYGIARDAVKSIVKAAEALVIRGDQQASQTVVNNTTETRNRQHITLAHLVVCDNCTDALFHQAYDLLEHRQAEIYNLVRLPFVYDALRSGPICVRYGLDFGRRRPTTYPARHDPGDYLSSLFPPHYMAALCNALAVLEKKVVLNASRDHGNISIVQHPLDLEGFRVRPKATCSVDASSNTPPGEPLYSSTTMPTVTTSDSAEYVSAAELIKPTKTLDNGGPVIVEDLVPPEVEAPPPIPGKVEVDIGTVITPEIILPPIAEVNTTEDSVAEKPNPSEEYAEVNTVAGEHTEEDSSSDPLDALLSELKALDSSPATVQAVTTVPPQKESIFVRLSNRIKALERNMSLSSQYLEELSRRYKRQVEEMSRTLNRTLAAVEGEARQREEKERRGEEEAEQMRQQLASLADQMDALVIERDSWRFKISVIGQHLLMASIEVGLLLAIWWYFRRGRAEKRAQEERKGRKLEGQQKRRKSVDGVSGHRSPTVRRKRPSEVALNITGTYSELLITESPMAAVDGVWSMPKAEPKRRKRKRRDLMSKSTSGGFLLHKLSETNLMVGDEEGGHTRRASLSELTSISIPSNGVQQNWSKTPTPPPMPPTAIDLCRVQDVTNDFDVPKCHVLKDKSNASVIAKVPKQSRTKESLDDVGDLARRNGSLGRGGGVQPARRLSSPAFMRTAVSARASRRVGEEETAPVPNHAKLKSDNWEFWHGSRKSSQTNLVPVQPRDPARDSPSSDQSSDKSSTKKSGGGLKKMVKRFF